MLSEEPRLSRPGAGSQPSGERSASTPTWREGGRYIRRVFRHIPTHVLRSSRQSSTRAAGMPTSQSTSPFPSSSRQASVVEPLTGMSQTQPAGGKDNTAPCRAQVLESSQSQSSVGLISQLSPATLGERLLERPEARQVPSALERAQTEPQPYLEWNTANLPPNAAGPAVTTLPEGESPPPGAPNLPDDTLQADAPADSARQGRHRRIDSSWSMQSIKARLRLTRRPRSSSSSAEPSVEPDDASPSGDAVADGAPILGREVPMDAPEDPRPTGLQWGELSRAGLTPEERADFHDDRLARRLEHCPRTSESAIKAIKDGKLELAIAIENEMEAKKYREYKRQVKICHGWPGKPCEPRETVETIVLTKSQRDKAESRAETRIDRRDRDKERLEKHPLLYFLLWSILRRSDPRLPEVLTRPPPSYTATQQARRHNGSRAPPVNGTLIEGRSSSVPQPTDPVAAPVAPYALAPVGPVPSAGSIQSSAGFTPSSAWTPNVNAQSANIQNTTTPNGSPPVASIQNANSQGANIGSQPRQTPNDDDEILPYSGPENSEPEEDM